MITIIIAITLLIIINSFENKKKKNLQANIHKIIDNSDICKSIEPVKILSQEEQKELDYKKYQNKKVTLNGDYNLGKNNLDELLKYTSDIIFNYYKKVGIFNIFDNIIEERTKNLYPFIRVYKNGAPRYSDNKMYDAVYFECLNYCLNFNIDIGNTPVSEIKESAFAKYEQYFFKITKQINKNLNKKDYEYFVNAYRKYHSFYYTDLEGVFGERINYHPYLDICHYSLYALINAYATLDTVFQSYSMKQLLTKPSEFSQVHNQLEASNVDARIISSKLCELFFDDLQDDFYLEDDYDFSQFMDVMRCLIIINDGYDNIINELQEHINNMTHQTIQENLLEIPFKELISDISEADLYLNCTLQYFVTEKSFDFVSIYDFYIYNKEKFFSQITQDIKSKSKKEDINRILSGDISQEVKKTKELYDFKNISDGFEFEEYVGRLYTKLGYDVKHTKLSGDQGADLVIKKDGITTVVQTKLYTKPVGNTAVQEVVASIAYYKADKGTVVTNNIFTTSAIELARKNNIELIDKDVLAMLIDNASKI